MFVLPTLQEPAFRLTAAEKDILRVIVEGERELINYIFNNVVYEHLQPQMQTVYHLLMEQFENSQTIEVTELLDSLSDGTTKKK